MKKQYLILAAAMLLAACTSSSEKPLSEIELAPEADSVLASENTSITITTEPSGQSLSADDFTCSGGNVTINGNTAEFSAGTPGSYTISAAKDGIQSNTITIHVVSPDSKSDSSRTGSTSTSDDQKTQNENIRGKETTDSSPNPSQTGSEQGKNADSDQICTVSEILSNPDAYLGKNLEVHGSVGQDAPQDSQGNPIFLLDDAQNHDLQLEMKPVNGMKFSFGGCNCTMIGTLEEQNGKPVLMVSRGWPTSNGSAGEIPNREPGTPASTLPQSGVFHFTKDDLNIRNGEDGLESPKSGMVYNAGMTVHYSRVYQKDGHTWIGYTGKSGKRHSVAVGSETTIENGYYSGS